MSDIVERLRDRNSEYLSQYCKPAEIKELRNEAADEIERLRALNTELVAALRKIADNPRAFVAASIARAALACELRRM